MIAPARRAYWAAAISCLGMMMMMPPQAKAADAPPSRGQALLSPDERMDRAAILELSDTSLIAHAWRALFPDSLPPEGEYIALIPAGEDAGEGASPASEVFLLRNGTQVGRFDRAAWDELVASTPARRHGLAAALEGPDKQEVPLLWEAGKWDLPAIVDRAEWPSGFTFGVGSGVGMARSSKPQYQRDIDFGWDQKLFGHFLLGASLHRSQYGGGLTRVGDEVADTAGGRLAPLFSQPFWGDGYWGWSFSAGVPGLRYTLSLADQPLPKYFWLETRASTAIRTHSEGRLVSQWTGDRMDLSGNLSQSLDARFGILRYGILFDFDAYRVPVQTVGIDDLPALFGSWGAGLVIASDLLATRAWVDIPDAALTLDAPRNWPTRFRFAFLRLEFDYRNQKSFRLGLSVRLNIQNPIMALPITRS